MLGVLVSCDDGLTQGPDEEFVADYAFGTFVESEGPTRRSELFAVTADGRRRYVTTGLRCANRGPAISPDGKELVFESCDTSAGAVGDLYRVDVDRLMPVNLTRSPFVEYDAAWSPRGEWIAFLRDRGAERTLEILSEDGTTGATLLATSGWLELGGWSPDGGNVVVALHEDAAIGQILTVAVPSAAVLRRTSGSAHRGGPVWSPDGALIAYLRDGELWCLWLDSNQEERFPVALDSVSGPLSWTHDARSVVLTGYGGSRTDICRIGIADSSLAVLTGIELKAKDATVLPDGRRIAYLVFNGLIYQLFTMDLQGFTAQRVTSLTVEEFGPVARPQPLTGREL
jgi:Tol biopolymer transport system component